MLKMMNKEDFIDNFVIAKSAYNNNCSNYFWSMEFTFKEAEKAWMEYEKHVGKPTTAYAIAVDIDRDRWYITKHNGDFWDGLTLRPDQARMFPDKESVDEAIETIKKFRMWACGTVSVVPDPRIYPRTWEMT